MNNKYILLVSFFVIGLFISGCGTNTNQTEKINKYDNKQPKGMFGIGNASSTFNNFLKNSVTSTVVDLSVGKKVLVFGAINSDNSVNAERIVIGDFSNLKIGGERRGPMDNNTRPNTDSPNNNEQKFGNGNNFRQGQLQTRPQGQGMERRGVFNMVLGEIFKKDDSSLVIKNDNGSRIVFYSDKTEVYLFQPLDSSSSTISTSTL